MPTHGSWIHGSMQTDCVITVSMRNILHSKSSEAGSEMQRVAEAGIRRVAHPDPDRSRRSLWFLTRSGRQPATSLSPATATAAIPSLDLVASWAELVGTYIVYTRRKQYENIRYFLNVSLDHICVLIKLQINSVCCAKSFVGIHAQLPFSLSSILRYCKN